MKTYFETVAGLLQRLRQSLPFGGTLFPEVVAAERELRDQQALIESLLDTDTAFDSLINAIPDLIIQKDVAGRYLNCNEAFARYAGRSRTEVRGLRPRDLFSVRAASRLEEDDRKVFARGESVRSENWVHDRTGTRRLFDTVKTPYFNTEGRMLGLIGIARNITARHEMEEELRRLATTDSLTGVLNRRSIMQKLREEYSRARRYGRPLSVLMIDIDHFKSINDQHGHDIGDEALRQTAQRCTNSLRSSDIFGRYGGEEFLAVLPEADQEHAMVTAERLRKHQQESQSMSLLVESPLTLTLSIGVATMEASEGTVDPQEGEGVNVQCERLLKRADLALYQAKAEGRNRVIFG